jgi:iron(III) transport system substrate-binding protein
MAKSRPSRRWGSALSLVLILVIVLGILASYFLLWWGGPEALVVYCAHDSVYSEKILREFEKKTGIPVSIRFDTEATKSLGLTELLIREKKNPRCDVFWNNQLLGTAALKEHGILQPYKGPGYERIPVRFKDPQGHWAGFAARLRVYIVNTDKLEPTEEAVRKALAGNLSRVCIAKPLYGTTLTHYSVLWHQVGKDRLRAWHKELRERGLKEVLGNATVKDLVAQGVCDLGLTDTDDFFVAKDEGKPVAQLPFRLETGQAICIPNTVAIIKGTRRLEEAKKLIDYLLSAECEVALANSRARQIPLGAVDEKKLSGEVVELKKWAETGYPLNNLLEARSACLSWLKSEYLK